MTHDTFTEKISLWLDNELGDSEVAELQVHLAGCPICRQTHRAMQQLDTLLRGGSSMTVAPAPGFTARFATRLAQHQARSNGHVWMGLGVLLLGTLFLFLVGGIVLSAYISAGTNLIDVAILYHSLADLIASANTLSVWFNLIGLFVKVSLLTMSQPLFWGYALVALGLTWMWLRFLKFVNRQTSTIVELLV
jgi:predicted anti-sigma-YlaC factor YlaD